jgi:hypothetical protein
VRARQRSAGVCAGAAAVASFLVVSGLAPASSHAADPEAEAGGAIEVHAFVSQGALVSTANNYLAKSARGTLEFAEVGINFTSQVTDRLRLGLQLFAHDLGSSGNYSAKADWFYLDYRWRDWLGIRAGRTKLPFGLYNEQNDVDAARVAVLLPQSIYPISSRDFLLAQTGVELYGYASLRAAGALEYRLYGGTIFLDTSTNTAIKSLDVPYLAGGRLMWETPVEGLRLGGSVQALRLAFAFTPDPTMPTMPPVSAALDAVLGVASVEFVRRDLVLAAEASQWRVARSEADLIYFPPGTKRVTVSERAYLLATYRVRPWFWPGAYYSVLFPDEANATFSGPSKDMQHDLAGTVRFDINAHWLVKLEGHYMHGTAGLSPALNGGRPVDTLTRDWAVFLVKTTAYF